MFVFRLCGERSGKWRFCFGSVGLSVCLSVSEQHYSKTYEWIEITFYGEVSAGSRKN